MNVRSRMIRGTGFAALLGAAAYGVAQADGYGPEVAFRDRTAVRYYSQCVNATSGGERAQNSLYEAESLDAAARQTGGDARARDVSRAPSSCSCWPATLQARLKRKPGVRRHAYHA